MCCTVDAVLLHAHIAISSNDAEEAQGMYQHLQCTASTAMAMEYTLTSPPIISISGSKASVYVVVLLGCVCLSVCLCACAVVDLLISASSLPIWRGHRLSV